MTRKFTVTIRDSLTTDDRECIIYDGTTEFLKVSFPSGEGEPKALKEALAAKTKDFIFTPEDSVNGPLKDVLQEVITPGTNPTPPRRSTVRRLTHWSPTSGMCCA